MSICMCVCVSARAEKRVLRFSGYLAREKLGRTIIGAGSTKMRLTRFRSRERASQINSQLVITAEKHSPATCRKYLQFRARDASRERRNEVSFLSHLSRSRARTQVPPTAAFNVHVRIAGART